MQLAEFARADCQGLVLAHRQNFADGSMAKGTVLTADHLEKLRKAGIERLICARPDADDVHEDEAAARLAGLLAPDNLECTPAATGRVNMKVSRRGLVRYERALISSINEVDERITFALVQHNQLLARGQMAATLKIIPFFVPDSSLRQIENLLSGLPAFGFHPLNTADVALIQTRIPGQADRLFTATEQVTADRLAVLGCNLVASPVCEHDRQAVAELSHRLSLMVPILFWCAAGQLSLTAKMNCHRR